ncbi:MAG: substrate-binding domain-containing protein [Lentisphaeria bacterium]|nr:substrate-binding domain-containing protein [Lentisphaeria bacterium]
MNKKTNVVERLRELILSGELQPGQKLKNGIELANDFGVAHLTMRRALRELELSGDINIIHGRGIFVSERHTEKRKFLLVRPGMTESAAPPHYILPYFLQRCNELGVEVDEADMIFLRHSPVAGTVRQLKDNQYTGILLACSGYNGTEPELPIFRSLNIPILIPRGAENDSKITGFGVLKSDERQAWQDGLKYLKECGMNKVGLILAGSNNNKRIRGFTIDEHLALLKQNGMLSDKSMLEFVDIKDPAVLCSQVEQSFKNLMSQAEPPEAIYCFSDFVALNVYLAAQKTGLRIPEDISVMGFCGYPGGKMLSPPLATVDCDYAAAGKTAAEMLCNPEKWYFSEDGIKDFIIPHKIKKRASVAVKKETLS